MSQSLFEFDDYKSFVNQWIAGHPSQGRGQLQKIAKGLGIHPTLVSHIFRGDKNLSLEQASALCRHLQLSTLETDYFLLLVQQAKSGSSELSQILERQRRDLRKKAADLINRVSPDQTLTEVDKAIFYSAWWYSGIRLLTSIPGLNTATAIQEYFNLPPALVEQVLAFLVTKGLCRFDGHTYSPGPAITHLESTSAFISRHHVNWRMKAIEQHARLTPDDLVFSGPLTISKKDSLIFREKLVKLIQELSSLTRDSESEQLRCFNLDWVQIR